MTRWEIVEKLAKEKRVEIMACNIAKSPMSPNLEDLCQMVYELLLTYDEAKIIDLWESGALGFFIARVLTTQYRSPRSTFYNLIRKFSAKSEEIDERTG